MEPLQIVTLLLEEELHFFHGTNSSRINDIKVKGLLNPFLSNNEELAYEYAEASEGDGDPVVLSVTIPAHLVSKLRYDGAAIEEPVGYANFKSADLEQAVKRMWNRESKRHPEWVKGGYISIPSTEWELSLNTVGSCWLDAVLPPEFISVAGD